MARCLDCDAITFGGFPTRTAAREAIAPTHDIEKAPGAPTPEATAPNSSHQETEQPCTASQTSP